MGPYAMTDLKIQFSGTDYQRILHYRIPSPLNINVTVVRNHADADAVLRNIFNPSSTPYQSTNTGVSIVLAIDTEWTAGPLLKKAGAQSPSIVQIYDGQQVVILQCETIQSESYYLSNWAEILIARQVHQQCLWKSCSLSW